MTWYSCHSCRHPVCFIRYFVTVICWRKIGLSALRQTLALLPVFSQRKWCRPSLPVCLSKSWRKWDVKECPIESPGSNNVLKCCIFRKKVHWAHSAKAEMRNWDKFKCQYSVEPPQSTTPLETTSLCFGSNKVLELYWNDTFLPPAYWRLVKSLFSSYFNRSGK